jgi:very-short-patch-repair endonuclease
MNSRRNGSVAVSHQSALVLHGLPDWGLSLDEVHVNRLDSHGAGRSIGVREHVGKVPSEDLAVVNGRLATTVPRSVVETACTASFEAAVVVADEAARTHRISEQDWARLLETIEFWPGSPTARAALAFMNPLSESVCESRLRVLMSNHDLPTPELQVEFHDTRGFVARVDFHFPAYGVVVEFDGMMKYADASAQVLIQEKVREDRLRALGLQVVRATWADLASPDRLMTHLRRALSRVAA